MRNIYRYKEEKSKNVFKEKENYLKEMKIHTTK